MIIRIDTMRMSGGREEYFVRIERDGRHMHIGHYRPPYRNRALYLRDELRHVLLGHDKPDLMVDKYQDTE